jgi:hypothetical protein
MYECLNGGVSTSQLAGILDERLCYVRQEIVRLHHLGIIEPIAIRYEQGDPPARLYFRDYVWEMTEHGRSHNDLQPECRACRIRERMLLRMGAPPF